MWRARLTGTLRRARRPYYIQQYQRTCISKRWIVELLTCVRLQLPDLGMADSPLLIGA